MENAQAYELEILKQGLRRLATNERRPTQAFWVVEAVYCRAHDAAGRIRLAVCPFFLTLISYIFVFLLCRYMLQEISAVPDSPSTYFPKSHALTRTHNYRTLAGMNRRREEVKRRKLTTRV